MQTHSNITLIKNPPLETGVQALNELLQIYWDQTQAYVQAELMGLPEPELQTPPLPNYLIYRI
ncbi:hypothetical protein [Methylophilus luteus]|uniref:Uncharacterized protein n=1 Tax=Methylophilus luteus TaxID=640108 RepID=A0ABW3F4G1_9PROT